ncbi:MAG: cadherin-like beta sandwich domain-containing protein [Fibrobacteria bacterium]
MFLRRFRNLIFRNEVFRNRFFRNLFTWATFAALASVSAFLTSCNTAENGGTFMNLHVDTSWYRYDSIQVLLDAGGGSAPKRIFGGKVDAPSDLNRIPADGYEGANVVVVVRGYLGDSLARAENRQYDGARQTVVNVVVVVAPGNPVNPQNPQNPAEGEGPQADAGPDVEARTGSDVSLIGKATAGKAKIAKQEWKLGSAAYAPVSNGKITFKAPAEAAEVKALFRVTDSAGKSDEDTAVIRVTTSPDTSKDGLTLIVTPKDTLISIKDSVPFLGIARNTKGTIAKAQWDLDGSGISMLDQGGAGDSVRFLAGFRFAKVGTYHPSLTIQGSKGSSLEVSVTVRVSEDRPVADAGTDLGAATGASVNLAGADKDTLGSIVKREWSIAGAPYDSTANGKTTFKAPGIPGDVKAVYRVTDDDGLTDEDTLVIHVISPAVAALTQIAVQGCVLAPAFSPDSLKYACEAGFDATSVTVAAKAQGTMTLNGKALEDGKASGPVALASGKAMLTLVVTNAEATRTYVISVTAGEASGNNALSALVLSAGILSPAFATATPAYSAAVGNAVASVNVTATLADTTASVSIQSAPAASGKPSAAIALGLGAQVIPIIVTAQNGQTRSYSVTVTRQAGEANLKSLAVSVGTLAPAFAAATAGYAVQVSQSATTVNITASPKDAKATLTLNGDAMTAGTATAFSLPQAVTTATLVVSAEDPAVTKTYTIKFTRIDDAPPTAPSVSLGGWAAPDRPGWTWTQGGGGNGTFRYRLDNPDLTAGATTGTALAFATASDLAAGAHILYVQERDSAGNWSASGQASVTLTALKSVADYPLAGHANDTAGANADATLLRAPFLSQGIYLTGVYPGSGLPDSSDGSSPVLEGFTPSNFSATVEFKVDALPTSTKTVMMGGYSYRWLGGTLEPDGKISMLYNNSVTATGTVTCAAGQWHTLKLEYVGGVAKVYLDGVVSVSVTVALVMSTDYTFGTTNFGSGNTFKGLWRNLRVYAGAAEIAHYPLAGELKDITKKQGPFTVINAPFRSPGPGVTLAGIYPGSNPTTGTEVSTPDLAALNMEDFRITAEFSISALPAADMPVVIGGSGYRWMGARIESTGMLTLLTNNSALKVTTTAVSPTVKHTVLLRYSAASATAAIYLDGILAGSTPVSALTHGNSKNISTSNYSTGSAFKGTLYRIRVDSKIP